MPLLYLLVLIVIVSLVSIYVDRRFVRNRSALPKVKQTQEEKNGSN